MELLWSLQTRRLIWGLWSQLPLTQLLWHLRSWTTGVVAPEEAGDSYPILCSAFLTREVFKEILSYLALHSSQLLGPQTRGTRGLPLVDKSRNWRLSGKLDGHTLPSKLYLALEVNDDGDLCSTYPLNLFIGWTPWSPELEAFRTHNLHAKKHWRA